MGIKNDTTDKDQQYDRSHVFVSVNKQEINEYHVHIDCEISDMDYFRPLQSILHNASSDDTVLLHLNSPGGDLTTALNISNWLTLTEARVVAVLEGFVASAATMFLFVADDVVILPHSSVMIHSAVHGYVGVQNRVKEYLDFSDKWLEDVFREIYKGFLTEDEINDVIVNSKEIWMGEDEVLKRLGERNKYLEENDAQEEEELG